MISENDLGPAEVLSIVRFSSKPPDVKELIFLTVGDLLRRGVIICKSFESDYKGTTGPNFFIKKSGITDRLLKVYENATISSLDFDSWISLKQYGYTLAKFSIDPLMYTKSYDFQGFVNESLIHEGLVKRKKAWLFFSLWKLTPLGESIKDRIEPHDLKRSWPLDLEDVRVQLQIFFEEKILYSKSALSQFNRSQYPMIITKG